MAKKEIVEETGRTYELSGVNGDYCGTVTVFEHECLLDVNKAGWTLQSLSDLGEALQTLYAKLPKGGE